MQRRRCSRDRFWTFNAASRVEDPETVDYDREPRLPVSEPGQVSGGRISVREALAGLRRLRGPDHPDTIAALNGLALTYRGLGKRAESESMFLEALDAQRRTLGPEHPDTLITMNNLALLYTNEGRYREARPLYREVLAIRRRLLGPEHPDTLLGMNNLGNLYSEWAGSGCRATLHGGSGRAQAGTWPEHPNTLNTMTNIAQLYFRQGKANEAERAYVEVLALRQRVMGKDHADSRLIMINLGQLYFREGS